MKILQSQITALPTGFYFCLQTSAVVDKHFVNKVGDKTAILRKYDISTKILVLFCWHYNVLFEKERIPLKTKYSKNKLSKRLDYLWKACCLAGAVACLRLSPPLFTWPVRMIHPVTWNLTRHVDREICPGWQHYYRFKKMCSLEVWIPYPC